MTCTGETLAAQIARLNTGRADRKVIHSVEEPYKRDWRLARAGRQSVT